MVVPASDGLVAPAAGGPAQRERETGAGDQSAGGLLGQAGQPGSLGDGQLDEAGAGRAWLAAADGVTLAQEIDKLVRERAPRPRPATGGFRSSRPLTAEEIDGQLAAGFGE